VLAAEEEVAAAVAFWLQLLAQLWQEEVVMTVEAEAEAACQALPLV